MDTEEVKDTIYHNCSVCGAPTSAHWNASGKPVCDDCYKVQEAQKHGDGVLYALQHGSGEIE